MKVGVISMREPLQAESGVLVAGGGALVLLLLEAARTAELALKDLTGQGSRMGGRSRANGTTKDARTIVVTIIYEGCDTVDALGELLLLCSYTRAISNMDCSKTCILACEFW